MKRIVWYIETIKLVIGSKVMGLQSSIMTWVSYRGHTVRSIGVEKNVAVGDEPFYLIKKTYLSTLVEETYFKTSFIKKTLKKR